jgi:hypothetical protein
MDVHRERKKELNQQEARVMKVEGEKLVFYLAEHWKKRVIRGFGRTREDKGWRSQMDTSRLSVPCARVRVPRRFGARAAVLCGAEQ